MVSLFLVISLVIIVSGALLVVLPKDEGSAKNQLEDTSIIDAECW